MISESGSDRFHFYSVEAAAQQPSFDQDVASGLSAWPKWLPPKYFYDERGAQLYEQICELPEYYPYRAERDILMTYADEIHAEIGDMALVEFGSGNSAKTRLLLQAYERAGTPFVYCPIDISEEMLKETAVQLLAVYSHLTVHAMHTDFTGQPSVVQAFDVGRKALAFLGSSLGNFTPEESADFLRKSAAIMNPDDVFLLGIDLKKAVDILVPAYDDAQGVTAEFNLNVLRRINHELGGQFAFEQFEHMARYHEAQGRIEMHLRSRCAQQVPITKIDLVVSFEAGETIHTENSYKYTVDEVRELGRRAGLQLQRTWYDAQHFFLLALFRPRLPS